MDVRHQGPYLTPDANQHQDRCSSHFPVQRPHFLNSKCTCTHQSTHGRVGLKMSCGHIVCTLLAYCYLEAAESDCMIDQQKPGLKSMVQCFTVILRAHYQDSNMYLNRRVHNIHSACYTHRMRSSAQTFTRIKGL